MTDRRAYAQLLLVIAIWAANFPLGKLAVGELSPITITAGRAAIAAPVLVVAARTWAPLARPLARRDVVASSSWASPASSATRPPGTGG